MLIPGVIQLQSKSQIQPSAYFINNVSLEYDHVHPSKYYLIFANYNGRALLLQ